MMVLVLNIVFLSYSVAELLNIPEGGKCETGRYPGTCVRAYQCATFILYDKPHKIYPETCSFDGDVPIICCTDCDTVEDARLAEVTLDGVYFKTNGVSKAYDKCLEFAARLPYKCKRGSTYSVWKDNVGNCTYPGLLQATTLLGYGAERGEFPHMALLGYGESVPDTQWLCGGSIISERYILTAGHCGAEPRLGNVSRVAVGILKRSDPSDLWQIHDVEAFIPHPEYHSPVKYNDIALLRTAKQIQFNYEVLPICLYTGVVGEDKVGQVAGWGILGHRQQLADTLQQAQLRRFNKSECDALYAPHRHLRSGVNFTTQACYGNHDNNHDTCEGDSGGPLQLYRSTPPPYNLYCMSFVIGVTSYGQPCGFQHNAGIYTMVGPYVPWIESVVWP